MASLEIKSLENIISAKKTFTNHGWKVMWNVSDEIVYVKRENSTSFLKIDKNLRMTGVHCKENIFEMSFAKLTLNNIESTLKTLETQVSQRFADGTTRNLQNGDALLQEIEANDNKKRPDNRKKSQSTRRFSNDDTMEAESDHQALWKCDSCPKIFKYKSQLKLHQKVTHKVVLPGSAMKKQSDNVPAVDIFRKPKQKHYCSDCKRYFNSNESLIVHKTTQVHKEKMVISDSLECKICDRRFATRGSQISHLKSFLHNMKTKNLNKPQQKFQQRRLTVDSKPGIFFKCKICELQFFRYTDLYLHKKYKHNQPTSTVNPLRTYRKPQTIIVKPSGSSSVAIEKESGSVSNEINLQAAIDIIKVESEDLEVKLENISNNPPIPINSHHSCIVISSDSDGSTSDSEQSDNE